MKKIVVVGYKRKIVGRIGGAFESLREGPSACDQGIAARVDAMLHALGADSKVVINLGRDGRVLAITPEHDEAVYGFESNPFEIAVMPWPGQPPFAGPDTRMVVEVGAAGTLVETLVATAN